MASSARFGVIGIGKIGSGIVNSLLKAGHSVIIWNRTPAKCEPFSSAGAQVALTPRDLVLAADIIISCVSGPAAVKNLVFGNSGILSVDLVNKGYVEITGIDPKTSVKVCEAIHARNGLYLEAQIQGSKEEAEMGKLVILAAGDEILFDLYGQSLFSVIAKAFYFTKEVGSASRMFLSLQVMRGTTMAGFAECMALCHSTGVSQTDFLKILRCTNLASPFLLEKGKTIIEKEFPSSLNLEHMEKDMTSAIKLGATLGRALPISAHANEMFKRARGSGYGTHDFSAVYLKP